MPKIILSIKKRGGEKVKKLAYLVTLVTVSRVIVAMIAAGVVGVAFLVADESILSAAGELRGAGVVVAMLMVACMTNVLDFQIYLGGERERFLRSLADLPPLWAGGIYLFLALWGAKGLGFAVAFGAIFCALTIPQAFGLPERCPALSTALGRFVPLVLLVLTCAWFSVVADLSVIALDSLWLLVGAIAVYVALNWRVGNWTKKGGWRR